VGLLLLEEEEEEEEKGRMLILILLSIEHTSTGDALFCFNANADVNCIDFFPAFEMIPADIMVS